MKKKMFSIAVVLLAVGCIGSVWAFHAQEKQKPQEIRGIIVDEHDVAWYETQQRLWQQHAALSPDDEHAWQQAFEAARYVDMLTGSYGRTPRKQAILEQMALHIPNSFVYNLCMYMTEVEQYDGEPVRYAEQALRLMPENMCRKDMEILLSYLWRAGKSMTDRNSEDYRQFHGLVQRLYATNAYPSYLLRYTHNSLQGMEENAIYFVNGDVPAYTSLVLQEALGVHTDKVIVPVSFLYIEAFRKALCQRLEISDMETEKDYASAESGVDGYLQDVLEHIIHNSKRPTYFFPDGSFPDTPSFKKNLYNEGLVFRYSTHPYDNVAVAKRNVEERYAFQYLMEPKFVCEEQWKGSERIQLNYMVMLAPIVKSYKEDGDTLHANQLTRYLCAAVVNTSIPQEEKQKYIHLLSTAK